MPYLPAVRKPELDRRRGGIGIPGVAERGGGIQRLESKKHVVKNMSFDVTCGRKLEDVGYIGRVDRDRDFDDGLDAKRSCRREYCKIEGEQRRGSWERGLTWVPCR